VNLLEISDYNKRYFGEYTINHLRSALQHCSYLLAWSVGYSNVPLDRFEFIDYGGGPGTLSLLAKELGIGTVVYNDIYDISCQDASRIAHAIKDDADHYFHGDIDELIDFLKQNNISCNAIASSEVIEHIYDIESYLRKLSALSESSLSIVMATSANSLNPIIKRQRKRMHLDVEYKDSVEVWG
jgi:2-polyprenyl-3-methyl-5-hydroxy-6-metoxy-1,4-benzoquinol methylase